MKPAVFVGSSVESISVAYAVQEALNYDAEVTVWTQGIFQLSSTTLDDLLAALDRCDFGVFVFSPDDLLTIRDQQYSATRDNVVFELGLFIGRLGKHRNFFVMPEDHSSFRIPTDLVGVTPATYDAHRSDANLHAALGPACNRIRSTIARLGSMRSSATPGLEAHETNPMPSSGSLARAQKRIAISPYFFERLGVPAVILEGDGLYEYRDGKLDMIVPRWQPRPAYVLENMASGRLRELCAKVLEEKQKIADENAVVFFNGRLARLTDYRPFRDDKEGLRKLELRLQPTDYFTFVATNHALESSLAAQVREHGLVQAETSLVSDLRNSLLANPMTVTISIITKEPDGTERLILQRRNSSKVMHCWQDWQAGAAGMVSMQPDTASTIPNPFYIAAIHEIEQETGIRVSEDEVVFLALVRESRFFEVGLLGEVHIERTFHSLLGMIEDPFEAEKFVAIPFTPEDLVRFLREAGRQELSGSDKVADKRALLQAGIRAFVPMALAAAVISLVHSCGSARAVEDAFID